LALEAVIDPASLDHKARFLTSKPLHSPFTLQSNRIDSLNNYNFFGGKVFPIKAYRHCARNV